MLRGLAWTLNDNDTELLAQAAVATAPRSTGYPFAPQAAATLITLLGRAAGDAPVRTLARLSLTVKNKALSTRVRAALAELGALRGWSPSEVLELAIDDHGLDAESTLTRQVGDYLATVRITEDKARLTFAREGKPLASVPASVKQDHEPELKALRLLAKEVDATLATERQRVEGMLSEERDWSYGDWVRRMVEHPMSGTFRRRLIFETTVDGTVWTAGLPVLADDGWDLVGHDGAATRGERIRLWVRGWRANYLGSWDGGYEGIASKELCGGQWRASFYHSLVEEDTQYQAQLCSTDQVRFERRDGAVWERVPMPSVLPLVLSEAMRDVDLFVGVTSIAADPEWVDRGEDRFVDYWRSVAFGALTTSAEMRRDALVRLLPRTKITDQHVNAYTPTITCLLRQFEATRAHRGLEIGPRRSTVDQPRPPGNGAVWVGFSGLAGLR